MSLFNAIVVAELPAIRNVTEAGTAPPGTPGDGAFNPLSPAGRPLASSAAVQPRFVVILPHGDASKLPENVLKFCFPDLAQLAKRPFHYEHSVEEFAFTLTSRSEEFRMHGFCRRYRVGSPSVAGRLDLTPYTSADLNEASSIPTYQCICILSERPHHRFFSQCLQLLHAGRLAGGPVALKLARTLLAFSAAPPGAILPLRSLLTAPQIPGCLQLPRERLRVPPSIGLPYSDVPLSPLLNRLEPGALLMLYSAMLCERRIMFVAQAIPTLTACVHAAVALLQPFEWQHIFIPVRGVAPAGCCAVGLTCDAGQCA